jgi:hypothetical protein
MHQKEMNEGQTISWCVQGTSEIWKSADGQKTGEEPVKNACVQLAIKARQRKCGQHRELTFN